MVQQLLRHALVDEARRALLVLRVVPSAGPSAARSDPMGAGGADRAAAVGSVRRGGRLVESRSSGGPLRAASRWACALAHAFAEDQAYPAHARRLPMATQFKPV